MKIRIEHDIIDGPTVTIDDQVVIVGDRVVCITPRVTITNFEPGDFGAVEFEVE